MKVFMIGGTGLLGSVASEEFISRGHKVTTLALPGLPPGAKFNPEMKIIEGDYNKMTDDEVAALMDGCDCFVFAAGVDERVSFPPPVYDAYYKYNVASVDRLLSIGKKAGITKAVVFGSYFTHMDRVYPEMEIAKKHPYVRSRLEQQKVALSYAADGKMDVSVLELPYIFGTQPGRKPVWTMLTERIAKMGPVTMYPKGGTAMVTIRQVGQATVGAAERNKGACICPIAMYNYTWNDFLDIVHDAMGQHGRKIINIPKWMFRLYALNTARADAKNGVEMGLNPIALGDLMFMKCYMDTRVAKELGVTDDDIRSAIFDSIHLSIEAGKANSNLIGMVAEASK